MNIFVIDAHGGGIGKQLVMEIKRSFPAATVTAAGADRAAAGENAVAVCIRKVDVTIGPRDQMLPSELAALLDLEVENIKHQGSRLKNVAEGDVGKLSVEIVGEAHGINYKKVMRYLRLNHLVPEFINNHISRKPTLPFLFSGCVAFSPLLISCFATVHGLSTG